MMQLFQINIDISIYEKCWSVGKGRFRPVSTFSSIFGETYIFMEITVEDSDNVTWGCSMYTCWLATGWQFDI